MVFENLEDIKALSLEDKKSQLAPSNSYKLIQSPHSSNMMLNPLKLKHLNNLDNLSAHAVTLNLEDAIAPSKKEEALINIALFLSNLKQTKSEIIVRINPLDNGGLEEAEFLKEYCFNAIRVSKIKSFKQIEQLSKILPSNKKIHISLETKEAFRDLANWGGNKQFKRANLGILDLLADLKLPQSILKIKNETISYILTKFLTDAKIAEVEPVSFMFQDYKNTKAFREFCLWERSLGFTSKACMGPAQVDIANKIFTTTQEDINRAKEIIKLFETNSKKGINGFMHSQYGFIDEPIYKDALNVIYGYNIH
jgi:citrate lyase subunit beta/citryl-CoA lyase